MAETKEEEAKDVLEEVAASGSHAPDNRGATHLCIVGVDKHWIEKDLIKFFRKSF